jgi:hypothetical protein
MTKVVGMASYIRKIRAPLFSNSEVGIEELYLCASGHSLTTQHRKPWPLSSRGREKRSLSNRATPPLPPFFLHSVSLGEELRIMLVKCVPGDTWRGFELKVLRASWLLSFSIRCPCSQKMSAALLTAQRRRENI